VGRNVSSGWVSFEVVWKDQAGDYTVLPFSTALASQPDRLAQVHNKIRMLQDLGWPEARRVLRDAHGHPLVSRKDDRIWLLKCKPSCWRLYFYVYATDQEKRIIYVHAVCKKRDREDRQDFLDARRIADGIRPGGSRITAFEFFD
jgi:hypothetical protein